MQATCYIRGGYFLRHRVTTVRPAVRTFSPFKHHDNVCLRSSISTVLRATEFNGEPEQIWEQYMKQCYEWVTLPPDLINEFPKETRDLVSVFSKRGFFLSRLVAQIDLLVREAYKFSSGKDGFKLSRGAHKFLQDIITDFSRIPLKEAEEMEMVKNLDMSSVFKFLQEKCKNEPDLSKALENHPLWHPDVIFIAYANMNEYAYSSVVHPLLGKLGKTLSEMGREFPENDLKKHLTMEKEAAFYVSRLQKWELAMKLGEAIDLAKRRPLLMFESHDSRMEECKDYIEHLFSSMEKINSILDEVKPVMVAKEHTVPSDVASEMERKDVVLYNLVAEISSKWRGCKVDLPAQYDMEERWLSQLFVRHMVLILGRI